MPSLSGWARGAYSLETAWYVAAVAGAFGAAYAWRLGIQARSIPMCTIPANRTSMSARSGRRCGPMRINQNPP